MPPKSMLLAVAGMVGTGKTTLTRALARRFGLQMALESVDDENPWLTPYYGPGPAAQQECADNLLAASCCSGHAPGKENRVLLSKLRAVKVI